MSDEQDRPPTDEELAAMDDESPALTALLKRSFADEKPAQEVDRALVANVQRKLRQRSKGKFYADGWSTTQSRINYGLVAAVMLVAIVAVYLALGPMAISR
ncbi:hypothetical protein AKJ09_03038 [Labilithrix luteola]|uniref:Uncharacterized protein n=1 Tax=Labilithrix luteola TaxID=1391654 RepID=A0A0K1PTB7_9BACT|nr:hypothetical protein [Labilithrix luteola]AKU96374.1 hypothetical protein AKJ09_03038 [Labilithrix luteola]